MKPAIEDVEDCQKPILRPFGTALDLRFKPAAGPRLPPFEESDCELNLGLEVAVKAGFRAARLGEDVINADLVDALFGK